MLLAIRDHLKERGQVSLAELILHFRLPAEALRPMVQRWVEKGKVEQLPAPLCPGCTQCEAEQLEVYRWHDGNLIATSGPSSPCVR